MTFYILRDRKALPTQDMMKWARMLEDSEGRTVAQTMLENVEPWVSKDRARLQLERQSRRELGMSARVESVRTHQNCIVISTVFIGLDHRFGHAGPPLLFETMIFNGPLNDHMWRCTTWEQAEQQHEKALAAIRAALIATKEKSDDDATCSR